jgi:glycosyltransferase involved in cell wall biosynthesis
MRTLQVIGSLDAGGAQAFAINFARACVSYDVNCDFAIDHSEYSFYRDVIESLGSRLYQLPELATAGLHGYKQAWKKLFEEERFDIVHAHARSTASLYLSVAKKAGIATVSHSHSTSNGTGVKAAIKDLMKPGISRNSDLCLACSKEAGKWLFGNHPFEVVPNAIHVEDYAFSQADRSSVREKLRIPKSAYVYGHVGRFNRVKNHDFLINVFSEIVKLRPDSYLILVGDGELRTAVENKCKRLNLCDKVRFVGNTHIVSPYYSAMDCMVFPSLWEGIPMTLVEAQAAGLPCVVSANVSQKAELVDGLVTFLSLDDIQKWLSVLVPARESVPSRSTVSPVAGSSYDMACQAKRLVSMYRLLLNGQS